MSRYKPFYKPLQAPNEIRVLQLEAATNNRDLLTAKLIHVRLGDGQRFKTLSLWRGEGDRPVSSPMRWGKVGITKNLGQALRHLLNGSKEYFWVDALCIEQDDVSERNHQVYLIAQYCSNESS
jgi:hypothetical protein